MRFSVLGSGSRGNSTLVTTAQGSLLIDAGLSCRALDQRLRSVEHQGVAAIDAVVISHEHADHVRGLQVLMQRTSAAVYCNRETMESLHAADERLARPEMRARFRLFESGRGFEAAGVAVTTFPIPHDAVDPVGFVLETDGTRLAHVTDLGRPTLVVSEHLRNCDAIVLEFNHDPGLLQQSRRPWTIKQRVLGTHGHLSNAAAAGLLGGIASARLTVAVLAHLSAECNRPEVALGLAREALARGNPAAGVVVAGQEGPTPVFDVGQPAPGGAVPAGAVPAL